VFFEALSPLQFKVFLVFFFVFGLFKIMGICKA